MGRFIMTQTASPLPPFDTIPPHLQTVLDYQQQAQQHLTADVWAYLDGGAMHENSVQQNRFQFEDIQLIPRHLKDLTHGHTRLNLFGQDYPHPIFLAPVGHQALFHSQAEHATALAAQVMHSNLILSHFSHTHLAELAPEHPYKWFQLYWQGSKEHVLSLIEQAEQCNYRALVVTVDAPHAGIRDRERKLGFQLPEHLSLPHSKTPHFPALSATDHPIFQGLMQIAPTWEDIAWIISQTKLPVILKGILHPADAQKALDYGISGLIISNHGGRILEDSLSPLIALQKIRQIVPQNFVLLLDGGIRRGTDIFKALACGANAVLVGRPYIYGLTVAGALGAAHVMRLLQEEFEITMALMGTATLDEINQDYIYRV